MCRVYELHLEREYLRHAWLEFKLNYQENHEEVENGHYLTVFAFRDSRPIGLGFSRRRRWVTAGTHSGIQTRYDT